MSSYRPFSLGLYICAGAIGLFHYEINGCKYGRKCVHYGSKFVPELSASFNYGCRSVPELSASFNYGCKSVPELSA